MNFVFHPQKQSVKGFQIQVYDQNELENYFKILKDNVFDSMQIYIQQEQEAFFLNLKIVSKCSQLIKKGGMISFAFAQPLDNQKSQTLLEIVNLLDLNVVEQRDQILVLASQPEHSQQNLNQQPAKAFGKSAFDQVVKVEPKANPFLNLEQGAKIDDSNLLANDVVKKTGNAGDCSTKKTACKNCSCGRSALEKQGVDTSNMKSNCGNCYLGDAFRCAGCPYRGMPAFKPGDRIKIDLNANLNDDTEEIQFQGGKVKIDL